MSLLNFSDLNSEVKVDKYFYSSSLELIQPVHLIKGEEQTVAATWYTGSRGMAENIDILRSRIKDCVDIFLSAWLSANTQ